MLGLSLQTKLTRPPYPIYQFNKSRKFANFFIFRHSYGTPSYSKRRQGTSLSGENASSANLLDLLLGDLREEPGLDDDGLLGQVALAQDLEVACSGDVDDGGLLLVVGVLGASLLGDQGPQLVQVDGGTVMAHLVGVNVEVPHTDLERKRY